MTRSTMLLCVGVLLTGFATRGSCTDEGARNVSTFNLDRKDLALQGYDPVAYFEEGGGKPLEGKAEHELTYQGVRYRFATAKNLELFRKNPARYEPMYGGWCAYAMASGERVKINPKAFLITDGHLYVFYWKKTIFSENDTREPWKEDPENLRKKADAAWKAMTEKAKRP